MATLTLRPNAAGSYQEWSLTDSTHWDATSDQSDATYVYVYASRALKETENIDNTSQTGTINSVTAYMRALALGSAAGETACLIWKLGTTEVESEAIEISRTAFTDYSNARTTNPDGGAWSWDDINNLEIGSRATTLGATETIQVSEYWIVVDYTEVNGVDYFQTVTDISGLLDSVAKKQTGYQTVSEQAGFLDSILVTLATSQTASDIAGLVDSVGVVHTLGGGVSHQQTVIDLAGFLDTVSVVHTAVPSVQGDVWVGEAVLRRPREREVLVLLKQLLEADM